MNLHGHISDSPFLLFTDIQVVESPERRYSIPTTSLTEATNGNKPSWECKVPIQMKNVKDAITTKFSAYPCVIKADSSDEKTNIQISAKIKKKFLPKLSENAKRSWFGFQIVLYDEYNKRIYYKYSSPYRIVESVKFFEELLSCSKIKSYGCRYVKLAIKAYFITWLESFKYTEDDDDFLLVDKI